MAKEIHFGTVTRNTDPQSAQGLRGAVFFESPTLTGGEEYSIPAEPCFPFAANNAGIFFVPGVGDIIEIEIDRDHPEYPEPRYRCGVYSSEDDIDDLFKENYPNRAGWVTKKGHFLVFDETDGQELVRLGHTFLTQLEMNAAGSWLEKIVRDKITDILKDHDVTIGGRQDIDVAQERNILCRSNETHVTEGDFVHEVKGDYILRVEGAFRPEVNEKDETPEQVTETSKGFRQYNTGGGFTHNIGGSKAESIVSNHEQTIAGQEAKLVTLNTNHTYGTGFKGTVGTGNYELIITLGQFLLNVLAGNIDLSTLAGSVNLANALASFGIDLAGVAKMSNLVGGSVEVDALGNVNADGTIGVFLGGAGLGDIATGGVLTIGNNPVIDNITGAPHIPSIRVIAS